jgi:hypothetical protein
MTLGTMVSPSDTADAWRSLRIARRRGVGMEVGGALLESVLRFLAIQAGVAAGTVRKPSRAQCVSSGCGSLGNGDRGFETELNPLWSCWIDDLGFCSWFAPRRISRETDYR